MTSNDVENDSQLQLEGERKMTNNKTLIKTLQEYSDYAYVYADHDQIYIVINGQIVKTIYLPQS